MNNEIRDSTDRKARPYEGEPSALGDTANFGPMFTVENAAKACTDIDAPGWQWFRKVALGFLTRDRDELLAQLHENPQLANSLFEMISHSERHAEQLRQWSDVMKIVHQRASNLSSSLGHHFDKPGRA